MANRNFSQTWLGHSIKQVKLSWTYYLKATWHKQLYTFGVFCIDTLKVWFSFSPRERSESPCRHAELAAGYAPEVRFNRIENLVGPINLDVQNVLLDVQLLHVLELLQSATVVDFRQKKFGLTGLFAKSQNFLDHFDWLVFCKKWILINYNLPGRVLWKQRYILGDPDKKIGYFLKIEFPWRLI